MQKKLHLKKGDMVRVISGNHKGKEGQVMSVNREKMRAVVEGVNLVSRHVKPSATNPQGGIEKSEAGIHISNLQVIVNGEPQRIGRKEVDGKRVRYGKKTGEVID